MDSGFPGIVLVEGMDGPELYINDESGEIVSWGFKNMTPLEWIKCLNTVMRAAKFGPIAARNYLEDLTTKKISADGQLKFLCCNMCGVKFKFTDEHFNFKATSGGIRFDDYQCSQTCYQKRFEQVLGKKSQALKKIVNLISK